jgi:alpha-1,6-mannosyltransferase
LAGWVGFAGVILSGALLALSAARTEVLLPESMRLGVPHGLAGAFGHGGIDLGLGGFVAALVVMFVSYTAMVRGAHRLTARPVLIGIACLNLLVLLAPVMLSTDVFSYIAYGRIGGVYGWNPYLLGPNAIGADPLYPFIGAQWVHVPTAYGPLFTGLSYVLAPLKIASNVMAYKTIAAVSSLVVVLMVWRAARLRGLDPVKAVAIVGLNPVIIIFGVGGGHNDLLMLAILLVGVYVLLAEKPRASGALIVTAAAVKLTAVVMLPFALAQSAGARSGARGGRALLTGAGVAAAIIAGFSLAAFGIGPVHLLGTLQHVQSEGGFHSVPGMILTLLGQSELTSVAGPILGAILLACVVWLVRRVWMGTLDWITAAGWATVVMLVTAGLLVPWYVAWLVPLAALSRDRRLLAVTVALTGLGLTTL